MASWQADLVSTIIRMMVKRRPKGSEADVVNQIRSSLELSQLIRALIAPVDLRAVSAVKDGSVKGEWLRLNGEPRQTIYYLHGGAYVACSPETHRAFTSALSRAAQTSLRDSDANPPSRHPTPACLSHDPTRSGDRDGHRRGRHGVAERALGPLRFRSFGRTG